MILHRDKITHWTEIENVFANGPSFSRANHETVPTENDLAVITMPTSLTTSIDRDGAEKPARAVKKQFKKLTSFDIKFRTNTNQSNGPMLMRQANLKHKKPPGTLAKFKSFTPAFTPTQPKE